jgi:hypothetical protein
MPPLHPRRRERTAPNLVAAALVLGVAACSGQGVAPSTPPSSSTTVAPTAGVAATPTLAPAPKPTSSPRTPAPAELQGRWRTVINDADKPVLTITDFKYTIERLGIGTGAVEVDGDQISFFGSNLCSGRGTYGWSIESGTLTLKPVDADPCSNRSDAIANRPFTRLQ